MTRPFPPLTSLLLLTPIFLSCPVSAAEEVDPAALAHFESKIRPILADNCYECHSVESGKSKGGLQLDSREAIRKGGDTGPAVVPGDPAKSLLLTAIEHADPDLEMPPKKAKLADSVIAEFREWIRQGAVDPREVTKSSPTVAQPPVDLEAGRAFWAFQKPVPHESPVTKDTIWAKRDLDHFILAALEAADLAPSPDAAPPVLLRRLHFDLVGLPPSPEAMDRFLARVKSDGLDAALEQEVDTLLASDRYGERWGRHWMDVARFAESSGKESNLSFPHAWRYRDYVIDAFNADIPYDRFLTEQIAGDQLSADTEAERARLLIATGFLAFGPKGLNEMNKLQFFADLADEQIDTVTRAVLAQSVACARCHDHKFDPFHMVDYYALAGIFLSTDTFFGTWIDSENNVGSHLIRLPDLEDQLIPNKSYPKKKVDEMKAQLAALNREEKDKKAAVEAAVAKGENPGELFTLRDALRIIWTRGGLEGRLETVDDEGKALPLCMGAQDRAEILDAPSLDRGEIAKPGEKVARGFPRVIEMEGVELPPADKSGRLELAHWLTHPDNPLTARVMANRVWRHLFGEGLVSTTDNFGFTGQRPSHPKLLDQLALQFVERGWSVKALVRELVLSRTYRQSSDWREAAFLKDPDNRLLWRANKKRLDAECIRDAMLAVSGDLDLTRRPGSLISGLDAQSVSLYGFNKDIPSDLDGSLRRSVYLPVIRDRLPDILDLFDFAEPSLVTGDRDTTNVPVQALYLMNSEFVRERAAAFAGRLPEGSASRAEKIRHAFALGLGRGPSADEFALAEAFFSRAENPDSPEVMAAFCQSLLSAAEFRNLD